MKIINKPVTIGILILMFVLAGYTPAARGEAFIAYGNPEALVLDQSYQDQRAVKAKDGSFFLLSPVEGNISGGIPPQGKQSG